MRKTNDIIHEKHLEYPVRATTMRKTDENSGIVFEPPTVTTCVLNRKTKPMK
jgi:hypothetical protein